MKHLASDILADLRAVLQHGPGDDDLARDLDDEFAFHIAQAEADLIAQGVEPVNARAQARARFGDVEKYRLECARIARKGSIMLQKINIILMSIVLVVLIAVAWQMWQTQKYNTLAIQTISDQLTSMKLEAQAPSAGVVYIGGDVPRPGVYQLPQQGALTLLQLLTAAGVTDGDGLTLRMTRGKGRTAVTETLIYAQLTDSPRHAPVLQPDDHVIVVRSDDATDNDNDPIDWRLEAERQRARAEAVTAFLADALSAADPAAHMQDQTVQDVLDEATRRLEAGEIDNPEVEARLRETVDRARQQMETNEDEAAAAEG